MVSVMMFAASAQLLDRSPVLLAKFNWLPAIVILGLQRCKITVSVRVKVRRRKLVGTLTLQN